MKLLLPDRLADKTKNLPEQSYGANRVTIIPVDGSRVNEVVLAWGREIVKIGGRPVSHTDDLDFRLDEILDITSEI